MAAAKRPGARAVKTPTKPGQVMSSQGPATLWRRATTVLLPRPWKGQSRVRRRTVLPPASDATPEVQAHS
jgi:hypothetical protein